MLQIIIIFAIFVFLIVKSDSMIVKKILKLIALIFAYLKNVGLSAGKIFNETNWNLNV